MHVATQFSVFLINKPGVLASVTGALASAGVNLTALALMDSGEHGALRVVCSDAGQDPRGAGQDPRPLDRDAGPRHGTGQRPGPPSPRWPAP